jgi:hypothetical protein
MKTTLLLAVLFMTSMALSSSSAKASGCRYIGGGTQNYGGGCTATYSYYMCNDAPGDAIWETCQQVNSGCGAYDYSGTCGQ